jgi:2-polyprenyl-3-methyl-5-hydroxy-6-metoxy-1,4-benzoquinol methylase
MSEFYRRKPVLINAIQFTGSGESAHEIVQWATERKRQVTSHQSCCGKLIVHLPNEGSHYLYSGDWIVEDGGHLDIYTKDEFIDRFEKVAFQAELATGGVVTDIAGFDLSWCPSQEHRNLLNELIGLEAVSTDNQTDGPSWMFKPYPISPLGKLLWAVMEDMPNSKFNNPQTLDPLPRLRFLEVGCGIGAKMLMVEKIFGLTVLGFDYNPGYVSDANDLLTSRGCRAHAYVADALHEDTLADYAEADIVYLNRPFVHLELQSKLEALVFNHMKPGAYIILANYATEPSWRRVAEDQVAVVFQKPTEQLV